MAYTRFGRLKRWILAVTLVLVGCGEVELYGGLTQENANKMVAALAAAGIHAERKQGRDDVYSVMVDDADFAAAVAALERRGLPRENFESLCTVFGEDTGWAPSPTRESARMACALSQELSRTVSEIDGVERARVHLALPSVDRLSRRRTEASASVAVHYHPGFDGTALTPRIKLLVANAVEGLEYEQVSIVLFPTVPATPPAAPTASAVPAPFAAPEAVAQIGPPWLGSSVALLLTALVIGAGAAYGVWRRRRAAAATPATTTTATPAADLAAAGWRDSDGAAAQGHTRQRGGFS